ncbi:MAG: hypothetical protein HC824_06220 [Synechococcales cyanobacterium RM1_1_8]|nr:hypothetical protein [Synechococcales cyanobacterium RM1_1_8]
MATQLLPLAALQKMRRHLQTTLTVPALENNPGQAVLDGKAPQTLGELVNMFQGPAALEIAGDRAPNREGRWFVSSINPGDALLQLKGLTVKPGWRLVPYLLRTEDGGVGHICAVPEDGTTTTALESALPEGTEWHYPPFPTGAMHHAMMALEGDRSLGSYMIASMLQREMKEFGALGKDREFAHHRLVDKVPPQVKWRWKGKAAKNFAPKVNVTDQGAAVEFFSCRTQKPYALYRHFDRYGLDGYLPESKDEAIAIASDEPAAIA